MKVLFASAEGAPFFKSGGLGDVTYALPKALAKKGVDMRVVLPFYQQMPQSYKDQLEDEGYFFFYMGNKRVYCGIKSLEMDDVTYYFIDNLDYFDRGHLYGDWDDGERFGYFSQAILEMLIYLKWTPDIIHCNDWQTSLVPTLLVTRYWMIEQFKSIRKVMTIHNLLFQGIYESDIFHNLFGMGEEASSWDGAGYYGKVNFLKGGINFSDRVTTVSPTYAREIMTPQFGEGLDEVLRYNSWKVHGIINGIDYDVNDPETDHRISSNYNSKNIRGKARDKMALQRELGLEHYRKTPIISMITRLTDQKGVGLVLDALERLVTSQDVQVVILGTGDAHYEEALRQAQDRHPDKIRALIKFDSDLAQRIYAGSDMFWMPSAFEPSGLSQMISMHYGTLPIVHEVGGLVDTVDGYNPETKEGDGFNFYDFNSTTLLNKTLQAIDVYQNKHSVWRKMMSRAMERDFSWDGPAEEYLSLYKDLLAE